MRVYILELLSPLYYNSRPDSGAAGTAITAPWVGDIALTYAINASLLKPYPFLFTSHTPNYADLKSSPLLASMARPLSTVKMLPLYDFATSFLSEGYPQQGMIDSTANASFRNWIRKQGIAPGNKFIFALGTKTGTKIPDVFTVRLGNMRSCLARAELVNGDLKDGQDDFWVNTFTLRMLRGTGQDDSSFAGYHGEVFSSYCTIIKGVKLDALKGMFAPYE